MGDPLTPAPATAPHGGLPFSPGVGCLLSVLAGLLCASAYFAVLWADRQGQIVLGADPFRQTRVWLLRDAEGHGVGWSTTRPRPGATSDDICVDSRVRFYFLGAQVQEANTSYCECYARGPAGWTPRGACPE